MLNINENISQENNISFHIIPTKKFKTINIVVKFKALLNRNTITKRALLPYILQQGTNKLPSEHQLVKKLDELYGAILSIDVAKKGNYHILSVRLEFANQKFINNESTIMDEAIQLLKDIIYDPRLDGKAFPEEIIEREKITLRNKLNAIYDDKITYANMRLIDEMCEDELFKIHTSGYEEDLAQLGADDMYSYYRSILEEDQMDVYVLGDFDETSLLKKLSQTFKRDPIPSMEENRFEEVKANESKEIIET